MSISRELKHSFIITAIAAGVISLLLPQAQAGPDKTFTAAMKAIESNQPDQIFAMLPPSYQKQIDEIVTGFAGKMDMELWTQGRAIAQRVAGLATSKRDLMIEIAMKDREDDFNQEELGASIDAFAQMLGLIANGPITDLQRLRQGNVQQLLATEGRKIMQTMEKASKVAPTQQAQEANFWEKARQTKVETESISGDNATLKITVGKDLVESVDMVKIEDRWIPSEWAADWQEMFDGAKEGIAAIDFTSPEGQQQKMQTMMAMGMLNMVVGQLEQAKTAEDLQSALMGLMMMGSMGFGGGAPGMQPME